MTTKIECEIYLAMNEDGCWEINTDADDAIVALRDNYGGAVVRTIKLTAKVAPPQIEEAELDVPDEAGTTEALEAEAA
jgi:hypothetical protein